MYFGIRLRHFRIEGLFIIPKMPKRGFREKIRANQDQSVLSAYHFI
jgi:hypothetical protein